MGDNKEIEVPVINQMPFLTLEFGKASWKGSTQSTSVKNKVLSCQSNMNHPCTDVNKNRIELGDVERKCGKVTRATRQQEDTNWYKSTELRHVRGSSPASLAFQGIESVSCGVKDPLSQNKGLSVSVAKGSELCVLPRADKHRRVEQIRATSLGPKSASTGNISSCGTTTSRESQVGPSSLAHNSGIHNLSPRPFRKVSISTEVPCYSSIKPITFPPIKEKSAFTAKQDDSGLVESETIPASTTEISTPWATRPGGASTNISGTESKALPKKHMVKPALPVKPAKPTKPVKPASLSFRSAQKTIKTPRQNGYVCSNGIPLVSSSNLKEAGFRSPRSPHSPKSPVSRGRPIVSQNIAHLAPGKASSPKSPGAPESPRSARSPLSPNTRARSTLTMPTSSSLAKSKDQRLQDKSPKQKCPRHSAFEKQFSQRNRTPLSVVKVHGESSQQANSKTNQTKCFRVGGQEFVLNSRKPSRGEDLPNLTVEIGIPATQDTPPGKSRAVVDMNCKDENKAAGGKADKNDPPKATQNHVAQETHHILLQSAQALNAKLEAENVKMKELYFRQMKAEPSLEKVHQADEHSETKAQLDVGTDTTVSTGHNSAVKSKKETRSHKLDTNFEEAREISFAHEGSKALQVDRGEKLFSLPKSVKKSVVIPSRDIIDAQQGERRMTTNTSPKEFLPMTRTCISGANGGTGEPYGLPERTNEANVGAQDARQCVLQCHSSLDEGAHEAAFASRASAESTPNKEENPSLPLCTNCSNLASQHSSGTPSDNMGETCHHLDSQSGEFNRISDGMGKTANIVDIASATEAEISKQFHTQSLWRNSPVLEVSTSRNASSDLLSSEQKGIKERKEEIKAAVMILSSDSEENASDNETLETMDYEVVLNNILWTDDVKPDEDNGDNGANEMDEEEPEGLASSIAMFLQAYESQLNLSETGNFPNGKSSNHSPPYIAGLSPVSQSNHRPRVPGTANERLAGIAGINHLAGFRSRSDSIFNATILEEREPHSSEDENENSEERNNGFEDIPGIMRNTPGRLGSSPSSKTESSVFQSDTSEEENRTSIHLDEWWQTWTLGSQRKSHESGNSLDTSDLEKVKMITNKMNLIYRRPSTLEWKEKYLDQPPCLWNNATGRPPVLKTTDAHEQFPFHPHADTNNSDWTQDRIVKINDAISWIRTELVSTADTKEVFGCDTTLTECGRVSFWLIKRNPLEAQTQAPEHGISVWWSHRAREETHEVWWMPHFLD